MSPQRRALFRHRNFQKWSETVGFWHFWLGNVLCATTACTFSTSQLPKVVWDRGFLTLLTWKCALRHNGVHFFDIATSKSGLRLWVTFDLEMCFAPQRRALFHLSSGQMAPHPPLYFSTRRSPKSLEKHRESCLSYLFAHLHLFSLFLFSDLLTSWLLLLDSSHLCFCISPYCRKFDFEVSFDHIYISDLHPYRAYTVYVCPHSQPQRLMERPEKTPWGPAASRCGQVARPGDGAWTSKAGSGQLHPGPVAEHQTWHGGPIWNDLWMANGWKIGRCEVSVAEFPVVALHPVAIDCVTEAAVAVKDVATQREVVKSRLRVEVGDQRGSLAPPHIPSSVCCRIGCFTQNLVCVCMCILSHGWMLRNGAADTARPYDLTSIMHCGSLAGFSDLSWGKRRNMMEVQHCLDWKQRAYLFIWWDV